jgi:hypothetical protein
MDRSFLSQPEVITASRKFVCVRLTTYENKEEGDFLKSFHVTRSGELENTVFTLLSPDGTRQLARAARSARQTFGDAARMATTMNRIAGQYEARAAGGPPPELPKVANVRLAIDVAACDNQPLVVLFGPDDVARRQLEDRVRLLAWSEPFLGQFVYVAATDAKELAAVTGVKPEAGVLVVQSDRFGLKGTVLRQAAVTASVAELTRTLKEGAELYRGEPKSFGSHVREGHQLGVFWHTQIEVTDPMERAARERGRGRGPVSR